MCRGRGRFGGKKDNGVSQGARGSRRYEEKGVALLSWVSGEQKMQTEIKTKGAKLVVDPGGGDKVIRGECVWWV